MPLDRYSTTMPVVVDVTLRDGGYANDHQFSLDEARALVGGLAAAGLPNIEVGYFTPELEAEGRPTASCPLDYLETMAALRGEANLLVMAHAAAVPLDAYATISQAGVSMVRLPCSPASLPGLAAHFDAIHEAGMRCSANLIRISELHPQVILSCARRAQEMGADWFYVADSNGMLVPEDVFEIVKLVSGGISIPLGLHLHNGLGLSFINALYGLQAGARMIDGSVGGMGKGGGNLPLEIFASYLNGIGASFDICRIVDTAETGLERWMAGVRESAVNAISSLLNLNLDAIAALHQQSIRDQVPLLDLISRRLSPPMAIA